MLSSAQVRLKPSTHSWSLLWTPLSLFTCTHVPRVYSSTPSSVSGLTFPHSLSPFPSPGFLHSLSHQPLLSGSHLVLVILLSQPCLHYTPRHQVLFVSLSPLLLVCSRKLCNYFITYFLTLIFLLFYHYMMTWRLNFQRKGLIFLQDLAFLNSKEICSFESYSLCYLTE